jgi:hypothetical protein
MSRKPNNYTQLLLILKDLNLENPGVPMAQHIAIATADDYSLCSVDDKTLLASLEKYKSELVSVVVPEKDIEKIIEEGTNLDTLFSKETEDEEQWDA